MIRRLLPCAALLFLSACMAAQSPEPDQVSSSSSAESSASSGASSLASSASSSSAPETRTLTLAGPAGEAVGVEVEVADTEPARRRGLMGRTELAEGNGMLFVFEAEGPLSFWMKDTLIPLDIVYFDEAGVYVSAHSMKPCHRDPSPLYASAGPARYALELPAGSAASLGIAPGWRLSLP